MTFLKTERIPTRFFGEIKNKYVDYGVAAETSPLIENFYDDAMAVDAIYKSQELAEWLKENHIERLEFGGGEVGITAYMIMQVPKGILAKIEMENGKKIGPVRAKSLVEMAQSIMETEPGY